MTQATKPAPYYITTPIYYVNDVPHIGHAYTTLACDVMARYKRLMGHEVFFLTGTDEHGQKVEKSAEKIGVAPQKFADAVSAKFRELTEVMHFTQDDFIRTTEARHKKAVQHLWKVLEEKGYIYEDNYAGWYSVRDEAFYAESETTTDARGNRYGPTGATVEWVEEPSYFFKLSAFQEPLLAHYKKHRHFIKPDSRRNEVMRFVEGGLKDLSISRTSFSWGVPVPGHEDHVMYVWLDALTNYLTAVGYPDMKAENYQKFWPANLHVVGKDILRFHAVYWPAFLLAADLPLPESIVAHGWWTNEGEKISKSLGNVIDPLELVEKYGLDQTRYFLMREVPFGNDGNFSHHAVLLRANSELANTIGNLAQRTLSMLAKHCDGVIPDVDPASDKVHAARHQSTLEIGKYIYKNVTENLEKQYFSIALERIINAGRDANSYIDTMAPWELRKTNPEKMKVVLVMLAEVIRQIAIAMQPFTPDAAEKLLDQLNVPQEDRHYAMIKETRYFKAGHALNKPSPVFPRLTVERDDKEAAA